MGVIQRKARPPRTGLRPFFILGAGLFLVATLLPAANEVPTDVKIPGTQQLPTDDVPSINPVGNCGCHSFTPPAGAPPESVPVFGWTGGMMANAGRDPLFWATLAVAEQDFLPGGGGVGDLCLHCHSVKGWLEGRSVPTDGFGLNPNDDGEGIMCEFCHLLTNPDEANSIPNPPDGLYAEVQNPPFVAWDESVVCEPPDDPCRPGYYGGAEYVLNNGGNGGTRLGPYFDPSARHDVIPSPFHRDARLCGTCHDVSNPAVGDLAHNHGSIYPFTGTFSGTVNDLDVASKAALNNPPESYGIVERTYSEWVSSALDTLRVNDFPSLELADPNLVEPGGALERAYQASLWGTCSGSGDLCNVDANCGGGEICNLITADYQQPLVTPPAGGDPRFYTCQTCHMSAAGGDGANQGRGSKWEDDPYDRDLRPDLPTHDQTGMSYWQHELIRWQDEHDTLRFGGGLSWPDERMDAGQARAQAHLRSAAHLAAAQNGNMLEVRVTNLTGHKLITGYPEGRRMWLNVKWYDAGNNLVDENGAYGELADDGGVPVTVQDLDGTTWTVRTILDPDSTKVYEAKPGMTKQWAQQLVGLQYPGDMVLEWDHETNLPEHTLQELAEATDGTIFHTFHFVLNNAVDHDNRIPPFRMDFDEAERRNALPVPADQYGNPGPGGVYDHWDDVSFEVPGNAVRAEVRLYYQATSWEYVQFLWKQPTSPPAPTSTFLANEGVHLLDAWLNTGMAPPFEMALAEATLTPVVGVPGEASHHDVPSDLMRAAYDRVANRIDVTYTPACDAADHTIYYGNLSGVSFYDYTGAGCFVGVDGTASFQPGPESIFFFVVANDGINEGSYGKDQPAVASPGERPEASGVGACDYPQNPGGVICE